MKIVIGYPPNYADIQRVFNLKGKEVSFTYGDTLYNPHGGPVSADFLIHETTHSRQQEEYGGVAMWWKQYLADPEFRLRQETEAYRNQYRHLKAQTRNKQLHFIYATRLARDLSSEIYGNMVSFQEALITIRT